ncbi:MAG TPA: YXWGXW repeat-containing protein [Rectinemataceae bacterium]|nr:YXWGXW repeat-containing protein [Rectinemataceae bacterium]
MSSRRNGLVGLGSALLFALLLLVLGAQATAQTAPGAATADVLRMAAAGVGPDVLLAYVRGSKAPFDLSADDIIALTRAKVEPQVIQAMLERDAALRPSADQAATARAGGAPAAGASSSAAASSALNPDPAAMPAPRAQYVPASPGPGYLWAPGYWSWNGDGWVWVYGYWHRPHFWWGWGWHHRHWR